MDLPPARPRPAPPTAGRARRWLLNLHLYGGLVTCWYLVFYGVSSLSFNHRGLIPEFRGPKVSWDRPLELPEISDNLKLAEWVRDRLGLLGWPLPWNMQRSEGGDLRFEMARPGKQYWIEVDRAAARVRVEEERRGLGSVLHFLHGSTEGVPGAPWLLAWGVYTEVTTWLVLFFAGSGIYLWVRRAKDRRLAGTMLTFSLAGSVALMAWIYLVG
jgi:hypothetical protein